MIDLEAKDYEKAQELLDSVKFLSERTRRFWKNYILSYCDVESKNVLEATASALKGLREYQALFVFAAVLVHNKYLQCEWKRYCNTKHPGNLRIMFRDYPGIDLHMRLFEETKCFLFERDNAFFKIPSPDSNVDHVMIPLEDPGRQKLREIYQQFGNGKQVPDKPIAELMQEILNVYRFRTEVVGERLLKLPLDDFISCYAANMALENPDTADDANHKHS